MKARALLPLCAGLAFGAVCAWTLRTSLDASESPASATSALTSDAGRLPAPAFVFPSPLAGADADAALSAYLALAPLPDPAVPAEIRNRTDRLHALFTLLPDSHFERLLSALASRAGGPESTQRDTAFDAWLERSPPAAARWALARAPSDAIPADTRSRYARLAALAWASDDFDSAYAWATRITEDTLSRHLLGHLLAQLAATDPRRALTLAHAGDAALLQAAQISIFRSWALHDPAAALRELGPTLLESREHQGSIQKAIGRWATREPAAALDWMMRQPSPEGANRSILEDFCWHVANTPEAIGPFLALVHGRGDLTNRSTAVRSLFINWLRNDSQAAVAWISSLPDVAERSDLIAASLWQMNSRPLEKQIALARLLPAGPEREKHIANLLAERARLAPDDVVAWLAQNSTPDTALAARRVEGVLIAALAKTDPAAAVLRWESLPAETDRADAARQLALNWGSQAPEAAARWLAAQTLKPESAGPVRDDVLRDLQNLTVPWAAQDPVAFVDWLSTLPTETHRLHLAQSVTNVHQAFSNLPFDPPPRAAFADRLTRIKDPQLRRTVLHDHLGQWMRSDRASARAWIESSDALSPEEAATLLSIRETFL